MTEHVGFDVSREATASCVKDKDGNVLARGKVATDPAVLFAVLREHCLCPGRIVMETGTLSGWLARELFKLGIAIDVIDARQAHAVMRLQHDRTDAKDADLLADIARTGLCRPVAVKSETAQEGRVLLKARAHLMGRRRDTGTTIRGLSGSPGLRFPKGSGKLGVRVRAALEERPGLAPMMEPLLSWLAALKGETERLHKAVAAWARANPACRLLMTVPGVGPVTALACVATIGDAERFARSRAVGAHVGLTSRRWQSGEMDCSGRISKHGDALLRSLLHEAANSLLTVVRRAHPLKDWARRVEKRDRPQEGLRGVGTQAVGDGASHADHRRSVSLAGKGSCGLNDEEETHEETWRFRASGRPVPAGTVAEAIPRPWLQGGHSSAIAPDTLARYPGRPRPRGTVMKRPGETAGDDFEDNRVPGGDKRVRKSLTREPELDNSDDGGCIRPFTKIDLAALDPGS